VDAEDPETSLTIPRRICATLKFNQIAQLEAPEPEIAQDRMDRFKRLELDNDALAHEKVNSVTPTLSSPASGG
jgi:hypothetical protein